MCHWGHFISVSFVSMSYSIHVYCVINMAVICLRLQGLLKYHYGASMDILCYFIYLPLNRATKSLGRYMWHMKLLSNRIASFHIEAYSIRVKKNSINRHLSDEYCGNHSENCINLIHSNLNERIHLAIWNYPNMALIYKTICTCIQVTVCKYCNEMVRDIFE